MLVTPLEDGSFCFAIIILYIADLVYRHCKINFLLERGGAGLPASQILSRSGGPLFYLYPLPVVNQLIAYTHDMPYTSS